MFTYLGISEKSSIAVVGWTMPPVDFYHLILRNCKWATTGGKRDIEVVIKILNGKMILDFPGEPRMLTYKRDAAELEPEKVIS